MRLHESRTFWELILNLLNKMIYNKNILKCPTFLYLFGVKWGRITQTKYRAVWVRHPSFGPASAFIDYEIEVNYSE